MFNFIFRCERFSFPFWEFNVQEWTNYILYFNIVLKNHRNNCTIRVFLLIVVHGIRDFYESLNVNTYK